MAGPYVSGERLGHGFANQYCDCISKLDGIVLLVDTKSIRRRLVLWATTLVQLLQPSTVCARTLATNLRCMCNHKQVSNGRMLLLQHDVSDGCVIMNTRQVIIRRDALKSNMSRSAKQYTFVS